MKIHNIIAFVILSFVLTSCFAKPVEDPITDNTPDPVVTQEDSENEDDGTEDENSEENEDENSETEDENSEETENENNESTGSMTEAEIIEGYEDELEALFDDMLGEDE